MLLSIVMMVKNEEKYLSKTLESLKFLMHDIDSELIILDTGSVDSTIEIAKKFTDKVFFASWNNDFAHMRNISISHASGEWILILDADEQLTNYDKLKEFFNSDLCNKYNSASISLKNIFSEDEKSYNVAPILRMFRNFEGFKYEGAIHEQPKFKHPIYNNIATFNHYGYLFEDEEVKQLKDNRNKKILLEEIEKNPNDPYINYQLGKNYMLSNGSEDALYYMEKAYKIYEKLSYIPIFLTLDLASLYVSLSEFNKCEKICIRYIKNDNKNIDIYYYLATSQKQLSQYRQSIENYKRYLYLLENYHLSTQANNTECGSDTLVHKNKCKVNMIDNYYKLEMHDEIVKDIDNIEVEVLQESYLVIFMSLYKLNKENKIIELYKKIEGSIVQQNKFKVALEAIINRIKENDRPKIYKIISNINGNYGLLNKIRIGQTLTIEKYNKILNDEEEVYFGECIYYGLKQNGILDEILKNISYVNMQRYIDYVVVNKRDCIFDLYNYLENALNTLNLDEIKVLSCLSKSLLRHGNLVGEKYKKVFLMYITYTYDYLKSIYDSRLTDEDLLSIVKADEEKFVIELMIIKRLEKVDKLEYIKKIKQLVIENQEYKKGIEILIKRFENEYSESEELKKLKNNYTNIIEKELNSGRLDNCLDMITEYEDIFKGESLYNLKSIINIYNKEFKEADKLLKLSYINNRYDDSVIFNIAYLKENTEDYENAQLFYNEALRLNYNLEAEINERLEFIKNLKNKN